MASMDLGHLTVELEGARAFVLAHGGLREQARLEGILSGTRPAREVVKGLEQLQQADGGFPLQLESGNPSRLDTTLSVLAQLRDLPPLAGSPMASRAVAFVRRCQQVDGSWSEEPGTAANVTASATYALLSYEPTHMDPIHRGAAWLQRTLTGAATDQETYATLAAAWAVFYRVFGPTAQETLEMSRRLAAAAPDAGELARWLTCALEIGAGGSYLLPLVQGLAKLAAMQNEDGSWPAGNSSPVEATLAALRVFRGFAII